MSTKKRQAKRIPKTKVPDDDQEPYSDPPTDFDIEDDTESLPDTNPNYATCDSFVLRLANKKKKLLTRAEEVEYIAAAQDKSHPKHKYAYNLFIERNQRIVAKVAFYYSNVIRSKRTVLDISDLVQEGNLGLMHAIDKFDVNRGFRFITYAYWWITDYIKRSIKNKNDLIRLPIHVLEEMVPVQRAWAHGRAEEQRILSAGELATKCGVSQEEVEQYRVYLQDHLSLDDNAFEDNDRVSIGDLIHDRSAVAPETAAEREEDRQYVRETISKLGKKDAEFIRRRFGLKDNEGRSRIQMGEIYKMSDQKVTKTEKRILKELAQKLDISRINMFLK